MRLTKSIWLTYKDSPNDAVVPSHQLMMRAGLIHKSAAGLYSYLPFAYRVIRKIENIVREEMDSIGSQEILMTVVTAGDVWQESGRWDKMGDQMLKFKDKNDRDLCISPTNEESVTDIFRNTIKSYKQLPQSVYQINTKFRDEIRPRFGLLRGREFTMKDAYSFHVDKESLDLVYQDFYGAYEACLKRMNLDYIIVEADAGAMAEGDAQTHEFQVIADNGEDTIIYSDSGYAANIEKAQTKRENLDFDLSKPQLLKVETPNMATIKDVCTFLKIAEHRSLKSLVYKSIKDDQEEYVLVLLLGDDELNELKLINYLGSEHLAPATDGELFKLNLPKGYIGPIGLKDVRVIYDEHIRSYAAFTIGALEKNQHMTGFVPERDGGLLESVDLRLARKGDHTLDGKGIVEEKKGIEVGHIFQLGDKYTKSLKANVLDQNGKTLAPLMGCYGMGITRLVAAAIEQHHDDKGIIWPKSIAPYDIYFALIGKSEEYHLLASAVYEDIKMAGFDVLFDDRKQGAGFKFKDSDLLGLPLRVVLGERDHKESGEFEIVVRKTDEKIKVKREDLISKIKELYQGL
jgi:prolyl-tRNA synthetase